MNRVATSTEADLPSTSSISFYLTAAVVVFAAFVPLILMTAPVVAAQLGGQLHLKPERIGLFFTVELGAMSLATLPSYLWLPCVSQRLVAFLAIIVFVVSNILAAFIPSYGLLLLLQLTTGLAGGTLMILCLTSAGRAANQDRVFGLWVIGQLILGALGLWVLPGLFTHFGLSALFVSLAILLILATPLAWAFPSYAIRPEKKLMQAHPVSIAKPVLGLLAVLAFYLSLGGVWTFMSALGVKSGIEANITGHILSIASLFGIAGAAFASVIGGRGKRIHFLIIGYAILVAAIALMFNLPALARFAIAACAFKFAWTFVLPYILAVIGAIDPSGRAIATVNLIIGGGLALGPIAAGWLLQQTGSFHLPLTAEIAAAIISFLLLLPAALHRLREA